MHVTVGYVSAHILMHCVVWQLVQSESTAGVLNPAVPLLQVALLVELR